MGFLDRIFGRDERPEPTDDRQRAAGPAGARSPDEIALERYRYMLRTAPPEDIERAHEEAFAALSPDQRRQVLEQLSAHVPAAERAQSDRPGDLARMATRAEMRQPGTIERAFGGQGAWGGGGGGGTGLGLGSVLLTSLAASFVGTAIAQSFFADAGVAAADSSGADAAGFAGGEGAGSDTAGDTGEAGAAGSEAGASDWEGGLDSSGSWDDAGGGDFGGGDFGGGDFGGGDFGGGDFGGA